MGGRRRSRKCGMKADFCCRSETFPFQILIFPFTVFDVFVSSVRDGQAGRLVVALMSVEEFDLGLCGRSWGREENKRVYPCDRVSLSYVLADAKNTNHRFSIRGWKLHVCLERQVCALRLIVPPGVFALLRSVWWSVHVRAEPCV